MFKSRRHPGGRAGDRGAKLAQITGEFPLDLQSAFTQLATVETDLMDLRGSLRRMHRVLGHEIIEKGMSAECLVCRNSFGWFCPDSVDGICEYDMEHGEWCIHCGDPEERK